jgi:hypothetical protein
MVERLKSADAVSGRSYWLCQKDLCPMSRADPNSDPNSPQFAQIPNSQLFFKLDRYGYFVVYYKIALTIL